MIKDIFHTINRRIFGIAILIMFVLVFVSSNVHIAHAQDTGASGPACSLSLGVHTSPKTVKNWNTPVTITVTLSRSFSTGYYCSNQEKATISFFYETTEGVGTIDGISTIEMSPDEVGKPSYKNESTSRVFTLINGTEKSDFTKRVGASAVVTRTPTDRSNVSIGDTKYETLKTVWATIKRDPNTKEPQTPPSTTKDPKNPDSTNTNTVPPHNSKDNKDIDTGVTATFDKQGLDYALGSFNNPLTKDTLPELLGAILKILFTLIGIISVIIIIIAGFRMVIASGNEAELTKAKAAITWAIIGLVVSLMAFSIVAIVQRLISVGA